MWEKSPACDSLMGWLNDYSYKNDLGHLFKLEVFLGFVFL
jgi:hypothetical protein